MPSAPSTSDQQDFLAGYEPAAPRVTALLKELGWAPFYDTTTGLIYNGEQAFVVKADDDDDANLNTAHLTPAGPVLGNGTEGNLEEHRNHPASHYALEAHPAFLKSSQY